MPLSCCCPEKPRGQPVVDGQRTAVYSRTSDATKVGRRFDDEDTLVQVAPRTACPEPHGLTKFVRRVYPGTWLAGLLLLPLATGLRTGVVLLCVVAIAYFLTAMMYQAIALRPIVFVHPGLRGTKPDQATQTASSTTARQSRVR